MQQGVKSAVTMANLAQANVPAYGNFLRAKKFKVKKIKHAQDFLKLPVSDKKNYIHCHKTFDLFEKDSFPGIAYASSGSSGSPTFWFRDDSKDPAGGRLHEAIFRDVFKIKKADPTLVIVCFSMGVWVAGSYTLSSCRWVAGQGYNLTTITPGIEKHDILNILKNLAPKYKQIILAGYPSFIMDVLTEVKTAGLDLPKNLSILTAGDSFSEQWRDRLGKLLGGNMGPQNIVSVYGSAEAGAMGFETPLTIFIRRAALANPEFSNELFGQTERQPAIVQFFPEQIYFETLNGELLLTCNNTIPLIRYNIHDTGKVMGWEETELLLRKHSLTKQAVKLGLNQWRLPFVIKYGRTDVAVTFYALNIYPENILSGMSDPKISKIVSGNFRAYNKVTQNHTREHLCIELELALGQKLSRKTTNLVAKTITASLLKTNIEYRKLHSIIGRRALPRIKLGKNLRASSAGTKVLLNLAGKKPKIVN